MAAHSLRSGPVIIFLVFWVCGSNFSTDACLTFVKNPLGYVTPGKDMIVKAGSSLAINCTLYPENFNRLFLTPITSKNIRFKFTPEFGHRTMWIENNKINHIDNYTAQVMLNNLSLDDYGKYNCYISAPISSETINENRLVCGTAVKVGYPPLDVDGEDLHCVSRNWQNMTCTWKVKNNTIATDYRFFYSYIDQNSQEIECKPYRGQKNKCVMTVKANASLNEGFYRQVSKYYYFTIRGTNVLGTSENKFQFNHYNYVLPNPPDELSVIKVSQRGMKLKWLIPVGMQGFPVGLRYQITFQSQWDKVEDWMTLATEDTSIELKGLLPYTTYTIKVRCSSKSVDANDLTFWSDYNVVQYRTDADVPRVAPNVTMGMFEDSWFNQTSRSITVYWKHVQSKFHNGPDFKYYVSYHRISGRDKRQAEEDTRITKDFNVHFNNLDLNSAYNFYVRVGNQEGLLSNVYSTIFVNDKEHMLGKPNNFYVQLQVNDTYQLFWKPPAKNVQSIKSYTIFWCQQRTRYFLERCRNPLDWVIVPARQQSLSLYIPDMKDVYYQFAVASNAESYSSGLVWTSCINGVISGNKVYSVTAVAKPPSSLHIQWQSTCVEEKVLIKGYKIQFCEAAPNFANVCLGPSKHITVQENFVDLIGLKYATKYIVKVSYIHDSGVESEASDPVSSRTFEGAPGPVDTPKILRTTNSSIHLSWKAPKLPNGNISKYKILYNKAVFEFPSSSKKKFIANLSEDISPFKNYTISVVACTRMGCSVPGTPVVAKTDIGVPGVIEAPRYEVINTTFMRIYWDKPKSPNGFLNMVDVNVSWVEDKNVTKWNLYNLTVWKSWQYASVDCSIFSSEDDLQYYNISVRAVNLVDDLKLYGPWSKHTKVNMCAENAEAMAIGFIIGVAVGGSIALCGLVFVLSLFIRWTIQKFDEAKTIKVQLPKGLESNGMTALNTYKDFSNGLKSPKASNGNISLNFSQYKPLIPSNSINDYEKKNRHESGDSAYSSNSTNELIQKRDRNNSNGSGDGLSENLISNNTKTHLSNHSNDSGLHCDLDNSQPSPEPVFMDSSPSFKRKNSPLDSSLKLKTPSLPIVNEIQDPETSPDGESQNTEVSDDSGTAEMVNDSKPNQYSKFDHYLDDKLKDMKFSTSPTVGLALTDGLGGGPPYCKLGINHLRGAYVPSHPGTATFLSKNSRNIAGSEPNIADADNPSEPDSGNSSVVNAVLPPYTRLGLASSHTDVSSNDIPMAYSKFGIACGGRNNDVYDSYIPIGNFLKRNCDSSPKAYPAAPYSKFGLLNIPTSDNVNANPSNPYLSNIPVQKWDIPKSCNPGYVAIERAEMPLFGSVDKSCGFTDVKTPEYDEGYSRVSAAPQDILPIPRDVDNFVEAEPIICTQSNGEATGAIPKSSKTPKGVNHDDVCNGYIPNNSLPLLHSVGKSLHLPHPPPDGEVKDNSANFNFVRDVNEPPLDSLNIDPVSTENLGLNSVEETATSTPKSSPQPSPSQLPKLTANSGESPETVPNCDYKSNGYVSLPVAGIVNPSTKNNHQPLSCANLQPPLTLI